MGILSNLFKKKSSAESVQKSANSLEEDIYSSADWVVKALNSSGYKADYTLESMKEIDRFFNEQSSETGLISKNRGYILFSLGAYIGQTAVKLYGGEWITDDGDPQGEINVSVRLTNGTVIQPVVRCMKRYKNGMEDSVYAYLLGAG